jgi:HCOMODA/2-hydroxy-3-carboxy-muconic semialdehyde decarboxylase
MLVRDDEAASGVAATLADSRAVVLRGNGAVTVGGTVEEATVLCWFLEEAARVELALQQLDAGSAPELTDDEATRRATWEGGLLDRIWTYLTRGDPEVDPSG